MQRTVGFNMQYRTSDAAELLITTNYRPRKEERLSWPTSAVWLSATSATSGRSNVCFAMPTASPLISLGRGQGWAIGHCQSLVHVPGRHFRLTFAVHSLWTLITSISKHICFCCQRYITIAFTFSLLGFIRYFMHPVLIF